jgi:hypothetical protein
MQGQRLAINPRATALYVAAQDNLGMKTEITHFPKSFEIQKYVNDPSGE